MLISQNSLTILLLQIFTLFSRIVMVTKLVKTCNQKKYICDRANDWKPQKLLEKDVFSMTLPVNKIGHYS